MKRQLLAVLLGLMSFELSAADDVTAKLDWSERAEMSTLVSGIVASVPASLGQSVKKGDVLLRLDQTFLKTVIDKAVATEKSAELNRQEAEKEWERAQELYDRTVLSDVELSTTKVRFAQAEAKHQLAVAELTLARTKLRHSEIIAPFDGIVAEVNASRGMTVVTDVHTRPMIVLGNPRPMVAVAQVSSKKISRLKDKASLKVKAGGQQFKAALFGRGVEANTDGDFELRVSFDPGKHLFRKGEKAEIVLP